MSFVGKARWVAAGILLSRLAGLARDVVFAHFFGTSLFADVFRAASNVPNVMQNLLGEGTLSASFIPVYAELVEQGRHKEAGRVAGAVLGLLVALAGLMGLAGILFSPLLVTVLLPGFSGQRRELSIEVLRIFFPMTGLFVLSAWALGVLNSHRQFFLAYVAPVLWNLAMVIAMVLFGAHVMQRDLLSIVAWAALIGGVLQFGVQLPRVLQLEPALSLRVRESRKHVVKVLANAGPAILGRGVVQLSSWMDIILASLLATGAVAALSYAQRLYLLPVSLFGMSVAAAELPELARNRSGTADALRERLDGGLRQIAFYVVPSTLAFLVLGDVLVAALFQSGSFHAGDTRLVYLVLAGYSLGLIASTATRLYSSAFYALQDTATPAKTALIRVLLAAALGINLMTLLEHRHVDGHALGAVGLSLAAGVSAWVEWWMLGRALRRHLGVRAQTGGAVRRMLFASLVAVLLARAVLWVVAPQTPLVAATLAGAIFAPVYLGLTRAFGLVEARPWTDRLLIIAKHLRARVIKE